jgi:glucose-6-phosphate 1-dehydrogenase
MNSDVITRTPVSRRCSELQATPRFCYRGVTWNRHYIDHVQITAAKTLGMEGRGGYKVAADSPVETYAALKLHVDNIRWAGVPFYLRSGKRLARRATEIIIEFKPAPHTPWDHAGAWGEAGRPNLLVVNVSPEEGIVIRIEGKQPGQAMQVRSRRRSCAPPGESTRIDVRSDTGRSAMRRAACRRCLRMLIDATRLLSR